MLANAVQAETKITDLAVSAYRIPTNAPESDGTLQWSATTMVCVHIQSDLQTGFAYTYAHQCAATLIKTEFESLLLGKDPMDIPGIWDSLFAAVRNQGQCGIAMMAISAVDAALWDLKGKLLDLPVATLLGRERDSVELYGSGGFTSYDSYQMRAQLRTWVEKDGMRSVNIKVGRDPDKDSRRTRDARQIIGDAVALFVDANSAYERKEALGWMNRFSSEANATWMEQPIDPNDLQGLRYLRDQGPASMDLADGEYGWTLHDFRRFADAQAVDVMMADATRCGGITGLMRVGGLCLAHELPISTHCAPSLHLHPCCALPTFRHCEYFHDHARIEELLFDGFTYPEDGCIKPDLSRPGLGIELKRRDAERFAL